MAGWQLGLVVMMAVGVAVIMFGALWDRERNRQAAERLTPVIPGYAGEPAAYVTLDGAVAPLPPALDDARRAEVGVRLGEARPVPAPLADPGFVNDDASGWAVVEDPVVLLCAERVESEREVLALLQHGSVTGRGLAIAAPGFERRALGALLLNQRHGLLRVVAVTADPAGLAGLAAASAATPVDRRDLQAGWIPEQSLGSAGTWVSSREGTWILTRG